MFRIWIAADGTVVPTHYVSATAADQERMNPPNGWMLWRDFQTEDELHAVLPKRANGSVDRDQRAKWRLTGNRILPDPTIPDPPHPRQAALDAIDQATTLLSLKTTLKQLVQDGKL